MIAHQDEGFSKSQRSKAGWESNLGRFIYNAVVENSA
jgi:hypothetical protein